VSLPDYLLDLPAEEAARLIALELLDRAAGAARRLADPTDPTARHDFRVATRRLRSCLRTYRPEIRGSVSRRLRRRLRRLARLTGRSRDLEAALTWERAQAAWLSERQQAGLRWHLVRLEARRRRADRALGDGVERLFPRLERRLRRRLERYRLRIERDPSRRRHEAAAVLGSRIRLLGGDLECRLGTIRGTTGLRAVHRARTAAQRLRYLLEPIRGEAEGVEALLASLRALEDTLRDLHDSQAQCAALGRELGPARREHLRRLETEVRAAGGSARDSAEPGEDPRPGLLGLAERLERRASEALAQLRIEWLHAAAEGFFEAVAAVGQRVASRPACDEEIERRFLLRDLPATARPFALEEIEQGWLPGTRVVARIRRLGAAPAAVTYRTARPATAGKPAGSEREADAVLFEEIWPLTAGHRVRKRRHVVPDYGMQWTIEQFLDRDLVLAEVALSEDAPDELPEWLQPYVVREVTGERQFTSRGLAQ
jgi:CHAD domain-containing protein/CYTH domain-containing protein